MQSLRAGGAWLALDFDVGGSRSEPRASTVASIQGWVEAAFSAAGARPRIGSQLARLLREAGLIEVTSCGIQRYVGAGDPGLTLLAGVVRSLAPVILKAGIASEAALDLDTLEEPIESDVATTGATVFPPTLVGAWGQRS